MSLSDLRNTIASGNGDSATRSQLIEQMEHIQNGTAKQDTTSQVDLFKQYAAEHGSPSSNGQSLIDDSTWPKTTTTSNSNTNNTTTGTALASTATKAAATVNSNGITNVTAVGKRTKKITSQTDRRIKLRPKAGVNAYIQNSILLSPLAQTNGLVFPADLSISVNNRASYGEQRTTHMNQDFRYYTNTPALQFDISGTFPAQNSIEAAYSLAAFHFISLLTKMHTGSNSSTDSSIGLPPPLLLLSGLGPYNFNDLPVIFLGGTYRFDPDVDMVTVNVNGVDNDVPSLCTISVSVVVQNTPAKLRTFNWDSFASGKLLASGGWK